MRPFPTLICAIIKKAHAFPFQRRTFMHNIYALLKIAWRKVKPSCIIEVLAGIVSELVSEVARAVQAQSGRVPLSSKKTKVWGNDVQRKIDSLHQLNGQSNPVHPVHRLAARVVAFSLDPNNFWPPKKSHCCMHRESIWRWLTTKRVACLFKWMDGCVRLSSAFVIFLSPPAGQKNELQRSADLFQSSPVFAHVRRNH